MPPAFDCIRCPRLVAYRQQNAAYFPDYHCRPVGSWGTVDAQLLIVGLAPGLHGANRTGRPFTGDASGDFLFEALRQFGWMINQDGRAILQGARITNAVKCAPPGNRVTAQEIQTCNRYLDVELQQHNGVILALGRVAHDAVLLAAKQVRAHYRFAHGAAHRWCDGQVLIDSYHCSRYNTQTGRLTRPMFAAIFLQVAQYGR